MDILTKEEFAQRREELFDAIERGALFIHPTDTIYGIGCDATSEDAVSRLRQAKERQESPFSIIAPSPAWIRKHCHLPKHAEAWLAKLPGPTTLILRLSGDDAVAPNVNPGKDTIGIRLPDHWFAHEVAAYGRPVITTSANKAGGDAMTRAEDLHPDLKAACAFLIDEGEKRGSPSHIIDCTGEKPIPVAR